MINCYAIIYTNTMLKGLKPLKDPDVAGYLTVI
jgi:hypothetical protein